MSIALVIQHAKRMRRIILSSVAYLALPYLMAILRKRLKIIKIVTFGAWMMMMMMMMMMMSVMGEHVALQ